MVELFSIKDTAKNMKWVISGLIVKLFRCQTFLIQKIFSVKIIVFLTIF